MPQRRNGSGDGESTESDDEENLRDTLELLADHLIAARRIAERLPHDELQLLIQLSLFRLGCLTASQGREPPMPARN
jgi:hypothetical protein